MKNQSRLCLLCAGWMVLAAQVRLDLFGSGLIISLGVVPLSFAVTVCGELLVLPASALAGAGNFLLRNVLHWLNTGTPDPAAYWPELVFYLLYGLLFFLWFRRLGWTAGRWDQWLPVAAIDLTANLAELLCRGALSGGWRMYAGLVVVAVGRTALACGFWLVLRHQSLVLLRREHAQQYRALTLLVSRLRGEIVWLRKSAAMIEDTMSTAYRLDTRLQAQGSPDAAEALSVSKDIHEIKKEYQLIVQGLSQALEEELDRNTVSFRELWKMLRDDISRFARQNGVEIAWEVEIPEDFRTGRQYQLLSILRNLLDNAVEAARDGRVTLSFSLRRAGDAWRFTVANTGRDIPPERLKRIFLPGYSTKIDYATGQVSRGLGLSMVKDLVESLGGSVSVESRDGRTAFTVLIPKASLEVSP